jgi:hypothetical protein
MRVASRYFTVFAFFVAVLVSAQTPVNNALDFNVIPPPPEAASLGKFIDMPTNPYTGVPKIDIPIYELKSHELSLPIRLSYHASGIKWEEIPSWVGAGWALHAGFSISRTIRGRNDEEPARGFLSPHTLHPYSISSFFNADGSFNGSNFTFVAPAGTCTFNPEGELAYQNVLYASKGGLDLEPDLFFFSLPDGQSGKFTFSRTGHMKVIPHQYLNISYGNHFSSWKIVGKDGTQYFFDLAETTQNVSSCGEVMSGPETFTIPPVIAPSSWRITKIKSANNLDSIWFEYESENLQYQTTTSFTHYDRVSGNVDLPGSSDCMNNTNVFGWRLRRIRTKAGYHLEFLANTNRSDIAGGKFLDEIRLFHKSTFIKRFLLTRGGAIPTLTALQECFEQSTTNVTTPAYEFTYYTEGVDIPTYSRTSPNIDHWGFYNAASNELTNRAPATIFRNIYYTGANREPLLEACRFMSLKEIKYPTGGTTTYDYELNDFTNVPSFDSFTYSPGLELIESIEFSVTNSTTRLPTIYQTKTFSLHSQSDVVILYEVPGVEGGGIPAGGLSASLTKSGTPSFLPMNFISGNAQINSSPIYSFSPGAYTLSGEFSDGAYPLSGNKFYVRIYRVVSLAERIQNNALKGGGLRVKKITTRGDKALVKSFLYRSRNTNQSSGQLMSFPIYTHLTGFARAMQVGTVCEVYATGDMLVRSNASTRPLTTMLGAHVGYNEVLEYHGEEANNNGYSVYYYTNTPDVANPFLPYVHGYSVAYKNGLLLKKEDFTNTHKKVREIINDYAFHPDGTIVQGIKVGQNYSSGCLGCPNRVFTANFYDEPSERIELVRTQELAYDMATDGFFENESEFVYDTYDQLIEKRQKVSNGGSKRMYTRYMYHSRLKNVPVQEHSYYYDPSNAAAGFQLIGGVKTNYDSVFLKPREVFLAEHSSVPQPMPQWQLYLTNSFVRRLVFDSFDSHGNVLSYRRENSPTFTRLIWDNDGRLPIAKVDFCQSSKVAFTSFENASNEGGWQFAIDPDTSLRKTGRVSHRLSNPITYSGLLPTERYVVSYWARRTRGGAPTVSGVVDTSGDASANTLDGWRYYERIVANVSAVTISGTSSMRIDELRLYPEGAHITTYTHDPKSGITSQAGQNYEMRCYEYNERLQLEFERDFDFYILKRHEYRYSRDN